MSAKHAEDPSLPAPPCIFHEEEFQRDFRELKHTVERIETAISGDDKHGHKGVIKRLDMIENRQDLQDAQHASTDRKLVKWGGIVTGIFLALQFLKDRIWK